MALWGVTLIAFGFVLAFVIGPFIYFRALRLAVPSVPWILLGMAGALGTGLWLRSVAEGGLTDVVAILLCLWAAWLLGCAALVLALRPRLGALHWRWARMLGAVATTAPWFGFAASRLGGS